MEENWKAIANARIAALCKQRNDAMDAHAVAVAENSVLREQVSSLQTRITLLEKELQEQHRQSAAVAEPDPIV